MFRPLQVKIGTAREKQNKLWPVKWVNLLQPWELQSADYAQELKNVLIDAQWKLEKREWYSVFFEDETLDNIWAIERLNEDIIIFTSWDKIYYYYEPTDTFTLLDTLTWSTDWEIAIYWDYVYYTNWTTKIKYATFWFTQLPSTKFTKYSWNYAWQQVSSWISEIYLEWLNSTNYYNVSDDYSSRVWYFVAEQWADLSDPNTWIWQISSYERVNSWLWRINISKQRWTGSLNPNATLDIYQSVLVDTADDEVYFRNWNSSLSYLDTRVKFWTDTFDSSKYYKLEFLTFWLQTSTNLATYWLNPNTTFTNIIWTSESYISKWWNTWFSFAVSTSSSSTWTTTTNWEAPYIYTYISQNPYLNIDNIRIYERKTDALTISTLSSSPICKKLFIYNWRLFAWNTDYDIAEIIWAEQDNIDDISNIPFTNWTIPASTPSPASPWRLIVRNIWELKDFALLWEQIIVFYENWKSWFRILSQEWWSGLEQVKVVDFERKDFWWDKAITTDMWVFYTNERWLWQLTSWWKTTQIWVNQEVNNTRILWEDFITWLDFSNSDLIQFPKKELILVNCPNNDTVLWYHYWNKSFWKFTGWNINNFFFDNNYVTASAKDEWAIYKLFDWTSDWWNNIESDFTQEMQFWLNTLNFLEAITLKWIFDYWQDIQVSFDIYDKFWVKYTDYKTFTLNIPEQWLIWENPNPLWTLNDLWNTVSATETETRHKEKIKIFEFSRIILKIRTNNTKWHTINWLQLDVWGKWYNNKNN